MTTLAALSGTAMIPYRALFFFGADDVDEVNREFEKWDYGDDEGFHDPYPDLTDEVTVVAAEVRSGQDYVWFIRKGQLETRPSWMLRAISE